MSITPTQSSSHTPPPPPWFNQPTSPQTFAGNQNFSDQLTTSPFAPISFLLNEGFFPSPPPPVFPSSIQPIATLAEDQRRETQRVALTAQKIVLPGLPFVTPQGARLWPAPEAPDGYYVVNLFNPRQPPARMCDTIAYFDPASGREIHRHVNENSLFIAPQQVKKQFPIRLLPPPHPAWELDALGITQEGKHVVQQQALRSCVPTTVAMLLLDKQLTPNYNEVTSSNLADDQIIFHSLERAGCRGEYCDLSTTNYFEAAKGAIQTHGPIILGIMHPVIGGHEIILDDVNVEHNEVTIRDPAYGAMLTILADVFLSWRPDGRGIQIL